MIDDIEALRKKLPTYISDLAREIAGEALHDFNEEHYASDGLYAVARWFDAALARPALEKAAEKYPSVAAMKAAVELEIKSALGFATTLVIGQIVQKAIDVALVSIKEQR
jgi:hypothetical protein